MYYRYINSTIAAPDAYDIIEIDVEKGGLTPDQRRNLGSIAKILQFAASNKGVRKKTIMNIRGFSVNMCIYPRFFLLQ